MRGELLYTFWYSPREYTAKPSLDAQPWLQERGTYLQPQRALVQAIAEFKTGSTGGRGSIISKCEITPSYL